MYLVPTLNHVTMTLPRERSGAPSPPTDADLVRAALGGSEDAFRALVERFERPVLSVLGRMVSDPALAEDLAQEAFVKAFRALSSYDDQRKFSSWLFKIAHNVAIDHLRRSSLDTVALETEDPDAPSLLRVLADDQPHADEVTIQRDRLRRLERALAHLAPDQRSAILLRFAHGLQYHEIAEITGWPMGTVKTRLHRARKALVDAVEGVGTSGAPNP